MGRRLIGLVEPIFYQKAGSASTHDHARQNEHAPDEEREPGAWRLGKVWYLAWIRHNYFYKSDVG
ncbi:MAG: hypothetical protein VCC01_13220, partial [Candidatus Hydrogenedentota bacterium]